MAHTRVIVVGGGLAGAAAASRLAPLADVVLVETEQSLGLHATGRSAATLSETSGTRAMCALARASRQHLENPEPDFTDAPLTRPRGLLWIGREHDEPALDALVENAVGISDTTSRITAARARELVPALRSHAVAAGGVLEPDARAIDVDLLLRAYARHAQRNGARLLTHHALLEARKTERGWHVITTNGDLDGDVIVNASGAWGDVVAQRCGIAPLGLQPLRRSVCIVRTNRDVADWPLVMDIAGRCYFEPDSGGLLLSPADEHPSPPTDASPEEEDIALAIDALNEATDLDVRSVRTVWAGLRTFTADRSPAIGPDDADESFVWLVGQGGAGIKTAPAASAALASAMGFADWPDELDALGVGPEDLAPGRFRQ